MSRPSGPRIKLKCFGCGMRRAVWPKVHPRFCGVKCAAHTAAVLSGEFVFCKEHDDYWDRMSWDQCPKCEEPVNYRAVEGDIFCGERLTVRAK